MATIHPRGDQRVLKCAQSMLDAGFRLHLIWVGEASSSTIYDDWLRETCTDAVSSTRERLLRTFQVLRLALRDHAEVLYIHDFYMLPHAVAWRLLRGGKLVFDSHEHYIELYSAKFPPKLRRVGHRAISLLKRALDRQVDGFSLVDDRMSPASPGNRPIIVTPNFPSVNLFPRPIRQLKAKQLLEVVHLGSLSERYGATVIIGAGRLLDESESPIKISIVRRFTSKKDEEWFSAEFERQGRPQSLKFIDPMPARDVQRFLEHFGVGLSAIQSGGQNHLAVPTKLYEYACVGLVLCASDLTAQAEFISRGRGVVGRTFDGTSSAALVSALNEIVSDSEHLVARVNSEVPTARAEFTWEGTAAAKFTELVKLMGGNRCT